MGQAGGRFLPLSLPRQMVCDLMALSQSIPLAHGERQIDIRPLRAAVATARPRPNWVPVFFKAYAMVAAARPVLRRVYVRRPWAHLYEHPENIGVITISRPLDGEDCLFALPISQPEKRSLTEIYELLKHARRAPIEDIPAFRRQLRYARLPRFIRRTLYRLGVDWYPRRRVQHLGTFGMSVLAAMGGATVASMAPLTTMIHYTPFDETGSMLLRLTIDQRVLDSLEAAHVLFEMEQVLNGPILEEVQQMQSRRARAA